MSLAYIYTIFHKHKYVYIYIYIYGPIYALSYDVGRWDVLALPWNVVTLWVQHTISIYVCLQPTYIQFFKEACLKCPWLICGVRAFYSSRMHFMFHFLFLQVVVALRHSRHEGDVTFSPPRINTVLGVTCFVILDLTGPPRLSSHSGERKIQFLL